jgi:hypothetical protein
MADIGDALTTARNVHYAITAGCAAAVLFAAIPDRTAPYRAAREDLVALRAIDWDLARTMAIKKGLLMKKGPKGDSAKVWREFLIRLGGDASNINSDAGKLDLVFRPLGDMEWWGGIPAIPEVTPQSTIAQLIELGTGGMAKIRRPMRLRGPPLNAVAKKCYHEESACTISVQKELIPCYQDKEQPACRDSVRQNPDTSYLVTVKYSHERDTITFLLHMEGAEVPIPSATMSPLLRERYPKAFVPATKAATLDNTLKDTAAAFVPRLAAIEGEIGKLTRAQAAGILDEKIAGNEQRLSALGIPVGGNLVTLAGPLLLILAIIYLSFHIEHLTELAPRNEEEIRDFAWPLTFRGWRGITTAFLSLLFGPVAAILLLRYHGDPTDAFSRSASGALTLFLFVGSLVAGWVCLRARNRLVRATFATSS